MEEYIGIDLGGTKILGVLLNSKLEVIRKERISSYNSESLDEILNNIYSLIRKLRTENVKKIGFGVAGFVDYKGGIIHSSPNIPALEEVNLKEIVSKQTGLQVSVDNDAKAGAAAELFLGEGKYSKDFLFITFGTGIGSAIVVNGKLVRGKNNLAGEIGHITLDPNGPLCSCGKKGCFEALAAGPAIRRYYIEHVKNYHDLPVLKLVNYDIEKIDTPLIFQNLSSDPLAKETISKIADYIGIGLSIVVNLLNPERVIISGGLATPLKDIFHLVMESFSRNALPIHQKNVEFRFSSLGNESVAIGSALLTFKNI